MGSVRLPKGEYSGISLEFAGDGIICEYAASVSDGICSLWEAVSLHLSYVTAG